MSSDRIAAIIFLPNLLFVFLVGDFMLRLIYPTLLTACFSLANLGCSGPESQTVDTESELWKQREAFYADPNNAVEQVQSEDDSK